MIRLFRLLLLLLEVEKLFLQIAHVAITQYIHVFGKMHSPYKFVEILSAHVYVTL